MSASSIGLEKVPDKLIKEALFAFSKLSDNVGLQILKKAKSKGSTVTADDIKAPSGLALLRLHQLEEQKLFTSSWIRRGEDSVKGYDLTALGNKVASAFD